MWVMIIRFWHGDEEPMILQPSKLLVALERLRQDAGDGAAPYIGKKLEGLNDLVSEDGKIVGPEIGK